MRPFNVTLIQPAGYVHALALLEAAQFVHVCLQDCGFTATYATNHIAPEAHNIVFCAHMMDTAGLNALPPDTIIFNSEQLLNRGAWPLAAPYLDALAKFYVWDHSLANLPLITHPRKDFIPFTFHPALVRSPKTARRECLVFYGALSERRTKLIADIRAGGVPVKTLFGVYGAERDAEMLEAWAVLNIHGTETIGTFEPIRCFHPLTNGVPVISEASTHDPTFQVYSDWLFSFRTPGLAAGVAGLYHDRDGFARAAQQKLQDFRACADPQAIGDAAQSYLEHL